MSRDPLVQTEIRLVLVGESNPYGADPRFALFDLPERASGYRLRTLILGVPRRVYHDAKCLRVNLCDGKWSAPRARERARELRADHPTAVFLLFGRKVATAFGFDDVPVFDVVRNSGRSFVLLPHPSGRNRQWEEPDAVDRAREAIRSALPDYPLGSI